MHQIHNAIEQNKVAMLYKNLSLFRSYAILVDTFNKS